MNTLKIIIQNVVYREQYIFNKTLLKNIYFNWLNPVCLELNIYMQYEQTDM